MRELKTIEVVGEMGNIIINEDEWPQYEEKGYHKVETETTVSEPTKRRNKKNSEVE